MVNSSAVQLCEWLVGGFIGTLIGAILLRTSCAVYNMLAGVSARPADETGRRAAVSEPETETSDQRGTTLAPHERADYERIAAFPGVPKPSLEWAMCIVFLATLVSTATSFIILRFLRLAGQAVGSNAFGSVPFDLVFALLGILILGGMNAVLLPTSFGKGLLVTLLFLLLSTLLAAFLAVVFFLIALAFGLGFVRFG